MAGFLDGLGSGLGSAVGSIIPSSTTTTGNATGTSTTTGTSTSQRVLSQQAIDKIIYDVLSADSGLASLATGENLSGGYANSTKALLAQDFVVKLAGELATVTAPTITNTTQNQQTQQQSTSKSKKRMSVICTHLFKVGLLPASAYRNRKAIRHFHSLHPLTITGYHAWAIPFVKWLERNMWAAILITPLFHSRYMQVITGKRTVGGFLTITLGHPICFAIGAIMVGINTLKGQKHGNVH